jgi:prolyl 4-hydroxylase
LENINLNEVAAIDKKTCKSIITLTEATKIKKSATSTIGIKDNNSLTSSSHIQLNDLSAFFNTLIEKILFNKLSWPANRLEPISIVRYCQGEEYKPHHDDYAPIYYYYKEYAETNQLTTAGNRLSTAIIYLNDNFLGGETKFPRIGKSIKPVTGKLVTWNNIDNRGMRIDDALHCGAIITSGIKYIVSVHLREKIVYI